ncbi:hypothetical protein [Methylobacterium sp. OAE515]|uniref:hypothetical protein n=1 Tax=Methylobacterium sp. OAE515 TaxID=2817895 RepID=UPI00178B7A7F
MTMAMQRSTARQDQTKPRPAPQERKAKFVQPTPKRLREVRKGIELTKRLVAGAKAADAGGGTDVTDMSSEDFIAFLRSR